MHVTPVAEYKGVALIEKEGDVPKKWIDGTTYKTDGHIWLIRRDMRMIGFQHDRMVKEYLDENPEEAKNYLSYEEVYALMRRTPEVRVGGWDWDEEHGVFVMTKGIRLGHHRR